MRGFRLIVVLVIACAAGVILGQLSVTLSSTRWVAPPTLVEGTLAGGGGLTQLDQLAALPYVSGGQRANPERMGVEAWDRERAFEGLNFWSSRDRSMAHLMDMQGREVHRWAYATGDDGWQHIELFPSGEILALIKNHKLVKLSLDSELLWEYQTMAHHDVCITDSGEIHVLTRVKREMPEITDRCPVMDDVIELLSPDGQLLDRISVLDALRRSPFAFLLPAPTGLPLGPTQDETGLRLDLLHTNHVEIFDGSLEQRSTLFARGNILVSMRTINTIGIIDPQTEAFIWVWGPTNLTRQHHPQLLDSGKILLFDNGLRRSQVIEMDPLGLQVVWRYAPDKGFFSPIRGSVQRLANGNTLITESERGRVFEITPDKEIVWDFLNPDLNDDGVRVPIWRMTRYSRDQLAFIGG